MHRLVLPDLFNSNRALVRVSQRQIVSEDSLPATVNLLDPLLGICQQLLGHLYCVYPLLLLYAVDHVVVVEL